jgi:hypothetical protein
MPAATEGMITDCRPSLRCSRTTAERTFPTFAAGAPMAGSAIRSTNGRFGEA